MIKPNYKQKNIVNLMSSIAIACGTRTPYKTLKSLPPKELKESKNIVLFVIDGFGFDFIEKFAPGGFFEENLREKIQTVFPPTTAAAITTIRTGLAPQQHGLVAWYMHFKELGVVAAPLPAYVRQGGKLEIEQEYLMGTPITKKFKRRSMIVTKKDFLERRDFKKRKALGYSSLTGLFRQLRKAVDSRGKKFIYCYWPLLDTYAHHFGKENVQTIIHLRLLQKKIRNFMKNTKNTTLIITADHGHIDTTEKRTIILNNHPKLMECLTLPPCGEPRATFCYVRPSKEKQFVHYVKKHFSKYCVLVKGNDLIKKNYFGLGKKHPLLFDRVGDYVLLAKENYTFRDALINEMGISYMVGNHGGISKEEMEVPLIVVKS